MAFIRSEKRGQEVYLSICENEREGNKIVQTRLYNLGKLSDYSESSLRRMGERLYEMGGGNLEDLVGGMCKEIARYNYGFPLIINYLFKVYNLDDYFRRLQSAGSQSYPLRDVIVLLLCNRWSSPLSKLGVYDTQQDYYDLPHISLQWIYRSLDKLAKKSVSLQEFLYKKSTQLLDYEVDVVFYDVTTFYFDSSVEEKGALRQKGFGKDGKIGKTQILLGLLLDKNRNPLGYELYSGDTYEGHTLRDGVKNLKRRYRLRKVIVVADSGMLNEDNLLTINEEGYEFIVGERLKSLPLAVQKTLLDRSDYQILSIDKAGKVVEKINLEYKIVSHKGRKILCTYSEKRAKKDRYEREQKIEKGKLLMKNTAPLGRKAGIYYLKSNQVDVETGEVLDPKTAKANKIIYEIDSEKIEKSAQFDGLKAIATSDMSLSNEDILLKYKELYQIEQAFRTFKSFIETRPMFHWTDERIKGHFALCYLSFCLLNYLQQVLKTHHLDHSENDIRKLFNKMQVTHLQQHQQSYYLRAPLNEAAKNTLKVLKIKQLPDLMTNALKINELH